MDLDSVGNSFSVDDRYKLIQGTDPIAAKNKTLNGKQVVDTFNNRTIWTVEFAYLTCSEYDDLRDVYEDQYTNNELLTFSEDNEGISNLSVYLNMPTKAELKFTKHHVKKFVITLEPEDPDNLAGVS